MSTCSLFVDSGGHCFGARYSYWTAAVKVGVCVCFLTELVLWLLGLVSSYTLGGFIHLLLIIAVVVLVIRLLQGRRTPLV